MLLASRVQRIVPKFEIPGFYLHIAYMGWQMNGLREACRRLDYDLEFLTLRQAASLIARLKYPEPMNMSPTRYAQIHRRTEYILERTTNLHPETLTADSGVIASATVPDF